MDMKLYDCIVCNGKVICLIDTPIEKRFCVHHSNEEFKLAKDKITQKEGNKK